jgi:flagellar biosynthesis GTPase FlhF
VSTADKLRIVPRTLVGASLTAARLPVTVAARVSRQGDNESWPPAVTFEGLEAGVETVLGSLLRDQALVERGRLRQAKVAQLRKAVELETLAAQERAQADAEFAARREQADQQREQAERQAELREQQVEQQAAAKRRQVEQKAATKAAQAQRVKAGQDKALDHQERTAKVETLTKESAALAAQKQALDAEDTVEVIEETLEGTKAARKTS